MRGRSRVTFSNKTKRLLRDIADEDEDADLLTRVKWLRVAAGHHTKMANKLIMVARYMTNKPADAQRTAEMRLLSYKIAVVYQELAGRRSKREKLTQIQKDQIHKSWSDKSSTQKRKEAGHIEPQVDIKIEEMQKLGSEVKEVLEHFETCDLSNVIHAAKITRLGEAHTQKAQAYLAKVKGEIANSTRERNTCAKYGGKYLSAAISEQKGKPMTNIVRDQDTDDGANKVKSLATQSASTTLSEGRGKPYMRERKGASKQQLTNSWAYIAARSSKESPTWWMTSLRKWCKVRSAKPKNLQGLSMAGARRN